MLSRTERRSDEARPPRKSNQGEQAEEQLHDRDIPNCPSGRTEGGPGLCQGISY